jgi:RNA polymerase sigma factor (sigma-70 family)
MTGDPKDLKARAHNAFERATQPVSAETLGPADPELLAKLEQAMELLPRRTREVFLANRIDGSSYADIARLTGLSQRDVQRQMVKALLHLSRFMDGDERRPWQRWWDARKRRWLP